MEPTIEFADLFNDRATFTAYGREAHVNIGVDMVQGAKSVLLTTEQAMDLYDWLGKQLGK